MPAAFARPYPRTIDRSSAVRCPSLIVWIALALALALAMSLVTAPVSRAAVAGSAGPLLWTAPGGVDAQPIDSIACPSTALCVAVDGAGNVITSPNPTGGGATWTVAKFDLSPRQNNTDNAGAVLVRGVACPSTGLCVAVDAAGNALTSTNPTGGATAWAITHIDTNSSYGCSGAATALTCQPPLVGIACPSTAQCAAVDFSGNLLTTTNPAGLGPWTSTPTDGGGLNSLYGISCPTVSFCATVNGSAGRAITLNPAAPTSQLSRSLPYSLYGIWCQSRSLCLASVQTPGGISGLLGSYDPAAPGSTWSLSSLGGINSAACPSASLCLAADDQGNVAAGATTRSIAAALSSELLSGRHLPTIARLDRQRSEKLEFTSPIAAQATLVWTAPGTGRTPVTLASASHQFNTPGKATLTLQLTAAGLRRFRSATRRLRLTATATFTASTGAVASVKQLAFLHPPKA